MFKQRGSRLIILRETSHLSQGRLIFLLALAFWETHRQKESIHTRHDNKLFLCPRMMKRHVRLLDALCFKLDTEQTSSSGCFHPYRGDKAKLFQESIARRCWVKLWNVAIIYWHLAAAAQKFGEYRSHLNLWFLKGFNQAWADSLKTQQDESVRAVTSNSLPASRR